MSRPSFNNQLFTWKQWYAIGPFSMQFSEVELTVPVGQYPVGTKFPHAFILGDNSVLVLVDEQKEEHGFDLKISVGEPVTPEESYDESCDCGHDHDH